MPRKFTRMKNFDNNHSLFLLGKNYFPDDSITTEKCFSDAVEIMKELVICTYRQNYERLGNSYLTSDAGWGCAIRSSQMLIANVIIDALDSENNCENLNDQIVESIERKQSNTNSSIRVTISPSITDSIQQNKVDRSLSVSALSNQMDELNETNDTENNTVDNINDDININVDDETETINDIQINRNDVKQILQRLQKQRHNTHKHFITEMFYDNYQSLFSIHNIYNIEIVKQHNPTGHSFLPPSICLSALCELFHQWDSRPFNCHFCRDYIPPCSSPTLLLIPRIVTQSERTLVKILMSMKQCRGFVGGVEESAIYVFGLQYNTVYFLDPHHVQDAGPKGYDKPTIYQINLDMLDNSMTFALMCENDKDCETLRELLKMGNEEIESKNLKTIEDLDGFEVLEFE